MSLETVEIWRAGSATDTYGDPAPGTWAKQSEYQCRFAPKNPTEPVEVGRNLVIKGGDVYIRDLATVPDIRATDRAKVRGKMLGIDGAVDVWQRSNGFAVRFVVKAGDGS